MAGVGPGAILSYFLQAVLGILLQAVCYLLCGKHGLRIRWKLTPRRTPFVPMAFQNQAEFWSSECLCTWGGRYREGWLSLIPILCWLPESQVPWLTDALGCYILGCKAGSERLGHVRV